MNATPDGTTQEQGDRVREIGATGAGAVTVSLLDARRVTLRLAAAEDRPLVGKFFDSFSEGSLEERRIVTTHAGTARQRHQLVEHTPDRGMILATPAGAGSPAIGVASYGYLPDEESCEIVVLVSRMWQAVGLGSALLTAAVSEARTQGFRHFHANMLGGDMPMLRLLREALARDVFTRVSHGLVRVDFEVGDGDRRGFSPNTQPRIVSHTLGGL